MLQTFRHTEWDLRQAVPETLILIACLLVSACTSFGPRHVPVDRFNYNQAVGRSANEQMLLNLVRMRYRDVPVFLAVSSVLTQYVYTGVVGVIGASGSSLGDPQFSVGGNANLRYFERPTITYSPLTGEEFAKQLLTPIPSETIFSLIQSGWPADHLLTMSLERLNTVENESFEPVPAPYNVERRRIFQQVVGLILALGKRRALEMLRNEAEPSAPRLLVFEENPEPETQQLIEELKRVLGLDPHRSVFRVTRQFLHRDTDEITIRVRSLLAMMGFLSRGVEVPAGHAAEKRAEVSTGSTDQAKGLVRIHSAPARPADAFVAVQYQDYWFYIAQADHASKQAFGLLTYLYQLQAPQAPSGAPLLTVPTG